MISQMTVLECVQIEWASHYYLTFTERYQLIQLIKRTLEK